MRWPFSKREKALTGTPPVLDAISNGWSPYPLLGGGSRQRIQEAFNTAQSASYGWMYRNSPALRAVIDTLVRNIGQLDLRLYEEVDDAERQPRPDHPAALSLRYPSETSSSDQFVRDMFLDYLLYSNAYAVILPANNGQLSFFRVPVPHVEVLGSNIFIAEGYRIRSHNGTPNEYTPDQIMHWHGTNPDDPRVGLSRLETLRGVIAEDAALQAAITELANSGMTEPYAFVRPLEAPEWSNEARKGFDEDLNNRLRRRNRMPVVLEEGIMPVKLGTSPRDAQMIEVRRWATERFCSVFGVPLGMVGLADNLEEAQRIFYADTLPPYCEDFTKFLNQRILVRAYNWTDGCFEFNLYEKQIGPDMLATLVSAAGGPVLLRDEARALISKPALADGAGEEIITPLNVTVGGKPSPQVMPVQDPNKPPQDGSYREEPKALEVRQKAAETPADASTEVVPVLHPRFAGDRDRNFRAIDRAQAVLERHYNRLERSARQKALNWERWDKELADDIDQFATDIVATEGEIYAFRLGGQFDINRTPKYIRALAEGAAAAINETIRAEIERDGMETAMANRQTHVESAGAGLGGSVTRWARQEAAKQSPDYESRTKTWIPDTARHAEFGGDTVPVGADWPAGFAPGSAPGCKCTMSIS